MFEIYLISIVNFRYGHQLVVGGVIQHNGNAILVLRVVWWV
jgi:hypothetical protein